MATTPKNPLLTFFANDIKVAKIEGEQLKKLNETLPDLLAAHQGDWAMVKEKLVAALPLDATLLQNMDFTHSLAVWSENNENLVKVFQDSKTTFSMRDIALNFDKTQIRTELINCKRNKITIIFSIFKKQRL